MVKISETDGKSMNGDLTLLRRRNQLAAAFGISALVLLTVLTLGSQAGQHTLADVGWNPTAVTAVQVAAR